jgi:hypothetical protein
MQSILLSPQVAGFRNIPSNDPVKTLKLSKFASRRSGDQNNLVTLLERTSITPLRELGTLHNPIMID